MYEPFEQNTMSHFGSNFWDGHSYKLKRDLFFYSELEYDHWILVECNPKILSFCEQPKKIDGYVDGEYKESIFDMWIKWEDGTEEFLEIKYSNEIENLDNRSDRVSKQIKLQQNWCKDNNYQHRIVTEKHIRIQPLLSNSKIILPYIKKMKQTSEITKFKILKSLNNGAPTTIKCLAEQLKEIKTSELFQGIFSLYLSNQVIIEIDSAPINQNTEVLLINE